MKVRAHQGEPHDFCKNERVEKGMSPARYRALNVPGSGINALISRRLTMVSWSRFLGASTEWPGVVPVDAGIGNLDLLAENYHAVAIDLRAIAASVDRNARITGSVLNCLPVGSTREQRRW
jgi:hypothetical protein